MSLPITYAKSTHHGIQIHAAVTAYQSAQSAVAAMRSRVRSVGASHQQYVTMLATSIATVDQTRAALGESMAPKVYHDICAVTGLTLA